jgi:tetratricopeptide (TPR) repeat protein
VEKENRLESWKEISSYLKRSIKTCQRWEIDLGLPVHRLDGTPSARVFAYPAALDHWMSEKLHHGEAGVQAAAPGRGRDKRWALIGAGATLGLAAVAVLIWHFFLQPPVSFPVVTPCVAFLPLENVSGDQIVESWRTELPHLISMDLIQSRVIGSWNPGDLYLSLSDLKLWDSRTFSAADLRKIGDRLGCDHLATGTLIRSGNDFVLNLTIRSAKTAEITCSFRTTCQGEEGLFDMVDGLTKNIKLALNISPRLVAHDIDDRVGDITTRSPEAFKLYCQADRLCWLGKGYEASLLFQKAVAIDPRFGEAYYGLFRACRGFLPRSEIIRYGSKAVELSDRMNVWSRYNLRGDFYQSFQKDYPKAIAAYEKLMSLMDDDLVGYSLGQIYWDLEEYDKAILFLERIKSKVKDNEHIIRLLAVCYASSGAIDKAEKVLDEHLVTNPKVSADFLHIRAVYAADRGKFDEALAFMDQLRSQYPNSGRYVRYSKGPVFITKDDFANAGRELEGVAAQGDKAEGVYARMSLMGIYLTQGKVEMARNQARQAVDLANSLEDAGWKRMSHANLSYLERLSGNLPEALREAEMACQNYGETGIYALGPLHLRAMITLEMGRMEEFDKRLAEIKEFVTREGYPKLMRAYYHLLGQRELRKKNIDKAIGYFWQALRLLPSQTGKGNADTDSARYFSSLGEAYYQAGYYLRALEMYEKVPPFWEQRANSGDIYAQSFYWKAKVHDLYSERVGLTNEQKKEQRVGAVDSYRKFLSLWGQADPIFAVYVEDARKRLAALETE